ncbi:TIGR03943 family protein [Amycolatopsis sp. NPDC051071]|uniref:TIGR03943 family putative permease subunit n=1 Tax=Amycolatopsis sp. NPDC051071 TaxID=3154637 RepID=UPI00344831D1
MKRETQNILLILLGGALLKITVNGDYLRYVKPAQQPWIIAGGAVMVALGAVAIVRDLLAARAAALDAHAHDHHTRSAWLLMVPVLAVFLVAPPALGADSVTRTEARAPQSASASNAAAFPPLPAGDVVPLEVNDFVSRAGWDKSGTLNGRTVKLSGFVVHNEGNTMLARLVIGCCAADAFPITVRLVGEGVSDFGNDTWLEVTGVVVPGTAVRGNSYMPDFTLTSVRQVPAPKDPYEY